MEFERDFERRSIMADLKYNMSFSTGGLFLLESAPVVEIYFETKNWDLTKEKALSDNSIQSKTQASLVRFNREIISRLQLLNDDQLSLLLTGTSQDKKLLLWLAACKKHKFIYDFAVEVLREKYLQLSYKITYRDFDIFFNKKAEWHEELDQLTQATRNKLRQVLFRMLRESDLLLSNDEVNHIHLTPNFAKSFPKNSHSDFSVFPISDSAISRVTQ